MPAWKPWNVRPPPPKLMLIMTAVLLPLMFLKFNVRSAFSVTSILAFSTKPAGGLSERDRSTAGSAGRRAGEGVGGRTWAAEGGWPWGADGGAAWCAEGGRAGACWPAAAGGEVGAVGVASEATAGAEVGLTTAVSMGGGELLPAIGVAWSEAPTLESQARQRPVVASTTQERGNPQKRSARIQPGRTEAVNRIVCESYPSFSS